MPWSLLCGGPDDQGSGHVMGWVDPAVLLGRDRHLGSDESVIDHSVPVPASSTIWPCPGRGRPCGGLGRAIDYPVPLGPWSTLWRRQPRHRLLGAGGPWSTLRRWPAPGVPRQGPPPLPLPTDATPAPLPLRPSTLTYSLPTPLPTSPTNDPSNPPNPTPKPTPNPENQPQRQPPPNVPDPMLSARRESRSHRCIPVRASSSQPSP